jgi:hypothetical protein
MRQQRPVIGMTTPQHPSVERVDAAAEQDVIERGAI